ncbi:RNA-binding S4 domain-containing protein [Pseudoramibacter sp.]|uniref:RNA-binding S4 domain-containing protein n=1 Tax=Pseudoramibacter sp. TaxID=2034862 RepID=UPI0025F6A6D9|nr:RNA-binding S4 domain-containing protein [Pseudoramibacter sp.]MCH4071914.1 RNA-binding S4 domain-containing protein [Pseudoramibacter sp.]MCH4105682.1 RNA-binding S4 domain-containing protein [Pseudoramibacter sp.]
MKTIQIYSKIIKLDQLLKFAGIAESGSMAKAMIQDEMVKVNGETVTARGKKLKPGDTVEVEGLGTFQLVSEKAQ